MNLGNYTFKQSVNNALMLARSKSFLLLLLIIALAFCVRTYKLQEVPAGLFIDEISGLYTPFLYIHGIVDLSLRGAISYFLSGTFFIYFLAGSSSLFARLSEDVFGTLLVFIVYLLAKEMFSKKVGLISALLIALCPWAVHFSRFQAYSSSYVLLFTTAVMFVYKGINSENERKKIVWYCLGSLTFGLTADIFASSSVFVPVFVTIFLFIYLQKKNKHLTVHSINPKRIFWPLVVVLMFILSYSPIFLIFGHRDGYTFFAQSYSTYSHSRNFADWFRMIIDRAGMHLSPGFLVFTFPHTHDLPFQETISKSSLLRYSPTEYGELNYYGVLLYPGILLLVYEWISKGSKKHAVILWWIVCYALVSGIAYYDNPNAARNIVGMPALIITIALVIDFLLKWASSYRIRIKKTVHPLNASIKPIVVIILSALVAVPTILFLYEYYVIYPSQSAKVFDYGYKQVADFLSTNNLWGRDILINKDPDRNMTLSFYSPHQPPLSRITNTYIRTPYMRKEISPLEISKDITPFYQGTIDYETRIDKGYRGSTSSHIDLVTTANHHLSLAIYHNDSSYTPNSYLLLQSDNKGKSQFDQRPLNQTIEYGKWYKVRLKINSTAISFYFDGKPITTLSRLTDSSNNGSSNSNGSNNSSSNSNAYTSIHLIGESAAVSFKDMVIEQNNQFSDLFDYRNNLFSDWQTIMGITKVKQDINGESIVSIFLSHSQPLDSATPLVYISKNIAPFYQGTIDYETRIDKGYRGPISSDISLVTAKQANDVSIDIYSNDSSYTPNSYLLLQSDNKGKSQFDQRPLNQTIEYGKWYKVRLKINSTAISFYFDGKPITTLSRLTDSSNNGSNSNSNAYTSIHLIGESAAVSFKDMVIQQNDQLPGIQVYRVVKIDPQNIVVTHPGEKSLVLANYGKSTQLLKEIYFPDGTVALDIFKIIYHERVS